MKTIPTRRLALAALLAMTTVGAFTACSVTPTAPVASGSGAAVAGESPLLTTIKARGKMIIGSSNDAPFTYIDQKTKELKGVDVEILKEVNKRLGIPAVEMKEIDFSNLLVELNNGNIDMVVDGMYVKDERLKVAAFSDKWYTEGEAIVIPQSSSIATKDDLLGKTIGAQPGTAFYETAEAWKKDGLVGDVASYDNQANLMTAVNMGKVDAVVTDGIVAGYTLAQDSTLKLKLLSPYTPEASGQIGSAVRFADEAFLTDFNKALNEMKTDGALLKILQSYGLSEDYMVGVTEGKTTNTK